MFAIAFDLVVADTAGNHPKGVAQAYADIRNTPQYSNRVRLRVAAGQPLHHRQGRLVQSVRCDSGVESVAVVCRFSAGYSRFQDRALVGLHRNG